MKKTVSDIIDIVLTKKFRPEASTNDFPMHEIVSKNWIDCVTLVLFDLKDHFKSTAITSSEWDYYDFGGFSASLPKENSNSEDVIGSEKEFKKEITNGFMKAQAKAIYEDELDEFYNELFEKYEFEDNETRSGSSEV